MTLPSSGALSMTAIAGEFGGAAPYSLNNYYAGGAHVASGTTGTSGAVPTSGQISISSFYGTSAALETQSVTVGQYQDFVYSINTWGYSGSVCGSLSPISSTIYPGHTWSEIAWNNFDPTNNATPGSITLAIFNTSSYAPNSGWTTVTINGTAYSRAALSYGQVFSAPYFVSTWTQLSTSACPFTLTVGAVNAVTFT